MKPGEVVLVKGMPIWLMEQYDPTLATTTGQHFRGSEIIGKLAVYKGRHGDARIYRILPEGFTVVMIGLPVLRGPEAELAASTKGVIP